MQKSRELIKNESEAVIEQDWARFKTQELHLLNNLLNCFLQVDYTAQSKFDLPKSVTHNNLVELNMNALRGSYQVDEGQFKELIGNLNWKKFAERIQEQLQSNALLTEQQKQLMEVNAVVSLMRSH